MYADRLMPRIKKYEEMGCWKFLGNLSQQQLAAFYPNLDVLVVPSLNSTEAFGLVQVEAMMNNVPCVASALPGVRRPVQMHAMGKVVPDRRLACSGGGTAGDFRPERQISSVTLQALAKLYNPDTVASEYEQLFEQLLNNK